MEDSIIAETVAQCSYNTAYKPLCGVRGTNTEMGETKDT
jgi:hypothetical protein